MHEKSKVRLGLNRKSLLQKLADAKAIYAAMNANPNFPNAGPFLAALLVAINDLETAKTDQDTKIKAGQSATETAHNREEALDAELQSVAGHVNDVARGDAAIIESAAMDSFATGKQPPIGPLGKVTGLEASEGDSEGEIKLDWNPLKGASSYVIEQATDSGGPWTEAGTSTASSFTVEGLTPGTRYWFRVQGVGTAGKGPFSELANKIAG